MTAPPKQKRTKVWYAQIGLSQQTFARLTKVKQETEAEVGISLSWNEFFILHLKKLKKGEKHEVS